MDVGGIPPSKERINQIRCYLKVLYEKWGTNCMEQYMYTTHQIPQNYSSILKLPQNNIQRCIWTNTFPPKLINKSNEDMMKEIPFPEISSN